MSEAHHDCIPLPRSAARFPLEMRRPPGFVADDLSTWPSVDGRLEYVGGRLWYMPPCGGPQGSTVFRTVSEVGRWIDAHPEFVGGTNEIGMKLGRDLRGADMAIWRREDWGRSERGVKRTPPVLAMETAGEDDTDEYLREKAAWYLEAGVSVVWLLFPERGEVEVITDRGAVVCTRGQRLPESAALPGLVPLVDSLLASPPA